MSELKLYVLDKGYEGSRSVFAKSEQDARALLSDHLVAIINKGKTSIPEKFQVHEAREWLGYVKDSERNKFDVHDVKYGTVVVTVGE